VTPRPDPARDQLSRAPDRVLWVNGRLARGPEAMLSAFDRGARNGEGIFETIRVEGGTPQLWLRHLERLVLSCAELGFPVPPAPLVLRRALAETLDANQLADAAARITVTRGIAGRRPTPCGCWIEVEPLASRLWLQGESRGVTAMLSPVPFAPGALGRHKTTSRLAYQLASDAARAVDAHEALLVSADGEVLEGAVSNVFIVSGREVRTPPLTTGILPGVMRRAVLECCRADGIAARETPLRPVDLLAADEVFLTNSLQQVAPVALLEERSWADAPLSLRIQTRVSAIPSIAL
jgi:branched-subunit amino acid aminotransferase/4-amino-4-deoxychorismate lyase